VFVCNQSLRPAGRTTTAMSVQLYLVRRGAGAVWNTTSGYLNSINQSTTLAVQKRSTMKVAHCLSYTGYYLSWGATAKRAEPRRFQRRALPEEKAICVSNCK